MKVKNNLIYYKVNLKLWITTDSNKIQKCELTTDIIIITMIICKLTNNNNDNKQQQQTIIIN